MGVRGLMFEFSAVDGGFTPGIQAGIPRPRVLVGPGSCMPYRPRHIKYRVGAQKHVRKDRSTVIGRIDGELFDINHGVKFLVVLVCGFIKHCFRARTLAIFGKFRVASHQVV